MLSNRSWDEIHVTVIYNRADVRELLQHEEQYFWNFSATGILIFFLSIVGQNFFVLLKM